MTTQLVAYCTNCNYIIHGDTPEEERDNYLSHECEPDEDGMYGIDWMEAEVS